MQFTVPRDILLRVCDRKGGPMSHVTYRIVRHEDGWAYQVDGTFSEAFPTHAAALAAARTAAREQRVPGHTEAIEYEDENGHWHSETASGRDRPDTDVKDSKD
jgi:Uncharacterized protein conserved in bacteria (DUF2188)